MKRGEWFAYVVLWIMAAIEVVALPFLAFLLVLTFC